MVPGDDGVQRRDPTRCTVDHLPRASISFMLKLAVWHRVAFPLSLAAAIAGAALVASSLTAAPSVPQGPAAPFPGGPYYAVGCSISHRNNDDAIAFPRQPGRSHNHTYIGNTTVNAATTPASLLGGATSCEDSGDSSAYWMPTLYAGQWAVLPHSAIVYYVKRSKKKLTSLPKGLMMIAGNAYAQRPQSKGIVAWSCLARALGLGRKFATIPACRPDEKLQLQVTFPSCWNGRAVDSRDHKGHVEYPSRGLCPASHPVELPTLVLIVLYPTVPRGAQVASGRFGAHADFMNGWNDDVLTRFYPRNR
jgi:hypothetical protein